MIDRFRTPIALALAAGLSVTLFAGCSSSDSKDSADSTTTTASASDDGSTSESVDASESSDSADFDICTGIDATQVGLILNATVTKEDVPGGGCNFEQDDPRAPSISFTSVQATNDTDFDAAKSAAISAAGMTDAAETDPAVGAQSFIATGTTNGGENQQAIAMMQDGDTIVTVIVLQGVGLDASQVQVLANQALSLAEQDI